MTKTNNFIKLQENFFKDEKILLLENLKNGYLYSNILIKLYLLGITSNGKLVSKNEYPYTTKDIATLINHKESNVRKALEVLEERSFITILENGTVQMLPTSNLIVNTSNDNQARVRKNKKPVLNQSENEINNSVKPTAIKKFAYAENEVRLKENLFNNLDKLNNDNREDEEDETNLPF